MITECQVKIDGEWITVDFDTAVAKHLSDKKRCPECWGQVRQYRLQGITPHFMHVKANPGCPGSLHSNPLK